MLIYFILQTEKEITLSVCHHAEVVNRHQMPSASHVMSVAASKTLYNVKQLVTEKRNDIQ
jgi:hypothetical protein